MTVKKLAEHLGNIDQRLIQGAEQTPDYGRRRRMGHIRRTLALAVAAVLMTASFAAGALSGDRGPETIPIPETGLTVVLPESWRGKCGYELQNGSLGVYLRSARTGEGLEEAGYLFMVECHEGSCDPAAEFAARQYVIASTPKKTYFLILPSDVQYDPGDTAVAREYLAVSADRGGAGAAVRLAGGVNRRRGYERGAAPVIDADHGSRPRFVSFSICVYFASTSSTASRGSWSRGTGTGGASG